jgi:peroxiredoxin Q/BCP
MKPAASCTWPICAATTSSWCFIPATIPAYAPGNCANSATTGTKSARGVEIFGVNPQSARAHGKFRQKYGFPFPLLVDSGQKVGALYRINGLIVKRTVYLIGRDGVIRFSRRGVPAPRDVLSNAV